MAITQTFQRPFLGIGDRTDQNTGSKGSEGVYMHRICNLCRLKPQVCKEAKMLTNCMLHKMQANLGLHIACLAHAGLAMELLNAVA